MSIKAGDWSPSVGGHMGGVVFPRPHGSGALSPSYWLVAAALVPEIALLFFIVTKILAMLNEPDESESAPAPADAPSRA
jgi:hypothetical protein